MTQNSGSEGQPSGRIGPPSPDPEVAEPTAQPAAGGTADDEPVQGEGAPDSH